MKEQYSLRERAKFSRRILRSPMPNEHPGLLINNNLIVLNSTHLLQELQNGIQITVRLSHLACSV